MKIDFGKLNTGSNVNTILQPRELFTALPKKEEKFQYPRDVQSQVWDSWFERRNESDLVLTHLRDFNIAKPLIYRYQ